MRIGNQRWRQHRASYRPPEEPICTRLHEVEPIEDDATARDFVEGHHYSGTYPAARFRYGLYRRGQLAGVAVFSHPCSDKVLTNVFPVAPRRSVELGRFVLLDEVEGNGETWFLARAFELLRRVRLPDGARLAGVVSFSDPVPRATAAGALVFPGHLGTIYQAHNGRYLGRGTPRTLRLLPDGTVLSARATQKIRKLERGWRYAADQLERAGAAPLDLTDPAGWLRTWLPRLTRTLRHPGNHRYAWPLARQLRDRLPAAQPYPKNTPTPTEDTP